ncbi:MAG: DNA polymerase IV, partial [Oscillospiraceae bacterium]|nr:DNA polymerase IV [Oscillospiraceae bacterium]
MERTDKKEENRKKRVILHCDCNSFYASVELLSHPELAASPVAVCGSVEDRRGIILAKNEAAKRKGVQTAETVWQAKRKCPDLVLLPPHHEKYAAISKKINEIYARYTDRVEPFSVDESWLDVTDTLHLFAKSGKELADRLRAEVKAETGVSISVGVSFNKVLAKLGSDYKKPDATTVIGEKELRELVWPMPVERLLFVGGKTRETLRLMGIHTIGQLAAAPPDALADRLGKLG